MKLFDLFKKNKEVPKTLGGQEIVRSECDINKTQIMARLFKIPSENRDDRWRSEFYDNVQTASFACANPQTLIGPDGFPYFILKTPEENKPFESFCIRNMMDDFLLDNGWGVTINPKEDAVDWVFSYGDLVNLYINHEFYSTSNTIKVQSEEIVKKNEKILLAQPSESYLPARTRKILKSYLISTGIERPQIMMVVRKIKGQAIQELAFNIYREDYSSSEELNDKLRMISWFLPKHYIILSVPKGSDFTRNFVDL